MTSELPGPLAGGGQMTGDIGRSTPALDTLLGSFGSNVWWRFLQILYSIDQHI
jgi:hypothetical protein